MTGFEAPRSCSALPEAEATTCSSTFPVFEEFHLAETLQRFLSGLVGSTKLFLAVVRKNHVPAGGFLDHV